MKWFLVGFGFFIDGLQALLTIGIVVMPSLGGAAGGWYICSNGGETIARICAAIGGAAGAAATPALLPFAPAVAFVLITVIGISMGTALILGLVVSGDFNAKYVIGGFIAEVSPLGILPIWGGMALMCVLANKTSEGGLVGATAAVTAGVLTGRGLSPSTYTNAAQALRRPSTSFSRGSTVPQEETLAREERTRPQLLNRDIRPPLKTELK